MKHLYRRFKTSVLMERGTETVMYFEASTDRISLAK